MAGENEIMPMGKPVESKTTKSRTPLEECPQMGIKVNGNNGGNQRKVRLDFHGSCVEKGGRTCVIFGGLIRTKDVFFVYGKDHEDTKCIIAPKKEADRLGETFSEKDAENLGIWKTISEFTAKLMGLKAGLEITLLEIDGEKNISVYNGSDLPLIREKKVNPGEYVEYVLIDSSIGKYKANKNTDNDKGILAECIKYYKDLKRKSENTNIECKVRVNKLGN